MFEGLPFWRELLQKAIKCVLLLCVKANNTEFIGVIIIAKEVITNLNVMKFDIVRGVETMWPRDMICSHWRIEFINNFTTSVCYIICMVWFRSDTPLTLMS